MIHTKTKPGYYDEKDYWTVSFTKIDLEDPNKKEKIVREYTDVDDAYEAYCYYQRQWFALECKYEHHRRED